VSNLCTIVTTQKVVTGIIELTGLHKARLHFGPLLAYSSLETSVAGHIYLKV